MKRGDGMLTVFPQYYSAFRCVGGSCRHSCCIGWDIGIDAESLARYAAVSGEFGDRLRAAIDSKNAQFITNRDGRCPLLNSCGLCDIQLQLGESYLCDICAAHPRFFNELPDRVEGGLGLCCEEAARLILTTEEPLSLCCSGSGAVHDDIIALRDELLSLLRDRTRDIPERMAAMLARCGTAWPPRAPAARADRLLSLERLDPAWTRQLLLLRDTAADVAAFDRHMQSRQTEYEQLLSYFVYRHVANAATVSGAAARAAFAALGYSILHALGAALYTATGTFSVRDHCELARAFSAEIEYSDENFYILLEELEEYGNGYSAR